MLGIINSRVQLGFSLKLSYSSAEVCFMSEGEIDHPPGLITVYPRDKGGRKPFKYFTMWKSSHVFTDTIQTQWSGQVNRCKIFALVTKLKKVKVALKELNRSGFIDIKTTDLKAHQAMIVAQEAMHLNPSNQFL